MAKSTDIKPPRIYPVLLSLLALPMVLGGLQLLILGGSFYYFLAGLALVASAWYLWHADRIGASIYGGLLRTRRVAGPVKSLIRHLNELADGGPAEPSLRFRRDDCFPELAASFNAFREAEHAQRRQGR